MTGHFDLRHLAEAAEHIRGVVRPEIYNHSERTYLLGLQAALIDGHRGLDEVSLHIAALFHDSGTSDIYNGEARFEVEGADAAARFLQDRGWAADRIDAIWEAIALHTTPGIPERRSAVAHYLRRGVEIDFGSQRLRDQFPTAIPEIEDHYPRNNIEEVLGNLVVAQAVGNPRKAPRPSWAADLVAHHRPDQPGTNPAF
jgi:hypothetical protein